jgi:OOP family OmpA-OmpF porin
VAEAIGGCVGDAAACDDAPIAAIGDRLIMSTTVLFDTDRARVRHHARPALERLAESLRAHPDTLRIRIEGHADVRGEAAYNLWLSQLRAERVAAALVGYGVRADQIDTVGYGNTRPRAAATDEAGHARNRRVEFVLIDARAATAPEAP